MNISPTPLYNHLLTLIGSPNAWRTCAELAKELGDGTADTRDSVAKSLWYLVQKSFVVRRLRPGTGNKEVMALVQEAEPQRASPKKAGRVEIKPPSDMPVVVCPPGSAAARLAEAVEKLVSPAADLKPVSPTPALTFADVLAKHRYSRAETGPLEDSSGPIASEAPALDIQAECATIADRVGADRDATPEERRYWNLQSEMDLFLERVVNALDEADAPKPSIDDLEEKLIVLRALRRIAPAPAAPILDAVVADLLRVSGIEA